MVISISWSLARYAEAFPKEMNGIEDIPPHHSHDIDCISAVPGRI